MFDFRDQNIIPSTEHAEINIIIGQIMRVGTYRICVKAFFKYACAVIPFCKITNKSFISIRPFLVCVRSGGCVGAQMR